MVAEGYTATLVARTLAISRSSLYYRRKPRGNRAGRTYYEQIVVACGEKPTYGYRRVAWWLQWENGLPVNRKRVLRVMRERGLLVCSRRFRATWLRKNRTPEDLIRFWLGHADETVTDGYSKLREEVQFRREVADKISLGFEISPQAPGVAPNVPGLELPVAQQNAT